MNIIAYTPPFTAASRRLVDIIQGIGDRNKHEVHDTLDSLTARLRHPMARFDSLLILCPSDGRELTKLTAIGHLLRDLNLIVLLPDGEGRTISEGHRLRPRFIGYSDGDLEDVAQVVRKMAASHPAAVTSPAHVRREAM